MKIERTAIGPFGTNCYLLTEDGRTDCVLVDAPPGAGTLLLPILKKRGLSLAAILLTHGHWDHNGGVAGILAATQATQATPPEICAHLADRDCHEHPEKFMAWYQAAIPDLGDDDFPAFKVSRWLADGETFPLLGKTWTALHVPGHCPGSLVYYCAEEQKAWTGDAVFAGSLGRTDLPGGSYKELMTSINTKLFTLPRETVCLCGHGPETTIGEEM